MDAEEGRRADLLQLGLHRRLAEDARRASDGEGFQIVGGPVGDRGVKGNVGLGR